MTRRTASRTGTPAAAGPNAPPRRPKSESAGFKRHRQQDLQTVFNHMPIMLNFLDSAGRVQWVNDEWHHVFGWSLAEVKDFDVIAKEYADPTGYEEVLRYLHAADPGWRDFRTRRQDGRVIETAWAHVRLGYGTTIGVGQDITERKRVEKELRVSQLQLRRLSARASHAIEHERAELARELHDQLGQMMTALKMELMWVSRRLPNDSQALDARDKIQAIGLTIDACVQKVRTISAGLRPFALDRLGLLDAIRWQAGEFERRTGVRCRFESSIDAVSLDATRSTQVFRIMEEALTNTARHANATRVTITFRQRGHTLQLEIRDNGCGISDQALTGHASLGLMGMRERALQLGAELAVTRLGKKGTLIVLTVPVVYEPIAADRLI